MKKEKIDMIRTDDELIFNVLPEPKGIVGWGIALAFVFAILLLLIGSLIKYTIKVEASAELINTNLPITIFNKNPGIISSISIQDGEIASEGMPLAIISSEAIIDSQVNQSRKRIGVLNTKYYHMVSNVTSKPIANNFRNNSVLMPTDGKVFIPKLWTIGERVNANEPLMIVIPDKKSKWICKLQISPKDIDRIEIGQKVKVYFDKGGNSTLEGYITKISQWQSADKFLASVAISENTNFIQNNNKVKGQAQIIVKQTSMLSQIFSQVNELIK
jgi:multidrug efflux pump subunit AcrA (membrane-fusion protein)